MLHTRVSADCFSIAVFLANRRGALLPVHFGVALSCKRLVKCLALFPFGSLSALVSRSLVAHIIPVAFTLKRNLALMLLLQQTSAADIVGRQLRSWPLRL